ncbi:dihydropteroate synthase [Peredibacter starrii]|uniref:Dihydropteroate synthase n=1 Tax=Peredibacter starrii TaxID=28202 RepID=A0AAX4HK89_9BACT|nr:dihydropteroate synthase [Peredibacter starrii]WPU63617.1 dihydropteroate synthase [Peredibacter starrii]
MSSQKLVLKRLGVMNFTPNSFSDGGELSSLEKILTRITSFGTIDALDIGAESTAPMNESIRFEEEWMRLEPHLSLLKSLEIPLSFDTYHPENIFRLFDVIKRPLIWNDVSGKFDEHVERFLRLHPENKYVFCHNLAPSRELSGKHMNFVSPSNGEAYLEELANYLRPFARPQVILDPTLGFSKTYEQNWYTLENFSTLQSLVKHDEWLLGFSRKSFLRKKLGIEKLTPDTRDDLDQFHTNVLLKVLSSVSGTVWIRTHKPEMIPNL